jgi:hypothetical protein
MFAIKNSLTVIDTGISLALPISGPAPDQWHILSGSPIHKAELLR